MKNFIGWFLLCLVPLVMADNYSQLYQAAGWSTQVEHFHEIVVDTQKQYQNKLPVMLYQALLITTNQRLAPTVMRQRGEKALREELAEPMPALNFFNSTLGKKIVSAETQATSRAALQKNRQGIPLIKISAQRKALINRLTQAIPYEQGAVNAATVIANLAANSLDSIAPNLGIGDTISQLVIPKKQIEQQVHHQLVPILVYIYRALSDSDLQQFVKFAESSAGKSYYQAALAVVNASLHTQ